jgi:Pilin (bacterial filament)
LGDYLNPVLNPTRRPSFESQQPSVIAVRSAWLIAQSSISMRFMSGIDAPDKGTYEQSVAIVAGNVLIVYGQRANPNLRNRHLAIYPLQDTDGTITWFRGKAVPPGEQNIPELIPFRKLTDVQDKHLPSSCRG